LMAVVRVASVFLLQVLQRYWLSPVNSSVDRTLFRQLSKEILSYKIEIKVRKESPSNKKGS